MAGRLRQAIHPTAIDSIATTSGATPCPYSPWTVTVASAANITVQPSAEPHSRVRARASRTAAMSSSEPVTKWNQCGYPHFRYSSKMDRGATMLLSDPTTKKAARTQGNTWRQDVLDIRSTFSDEGAAEDPCGRPRDDAGRVPLFMPSWACGPP